MEYNIKKYALFFGLFILGANFDLYNAARIVVEDENQEEISNENNVDNDNAVEGDLVEDNSSDDEIEGDWPLTSIDKKLLKFAKEGNLEGVKKTIAQGAYSNCAIEIPESFKIKENEEVESIKSLKYWNLPESGCEYEFTPLMLACKYGHTEIVKFLLSQKNISVKKTTNHHSFDTVDWYTHDNNLTEIDAMFVSLMYKQYEMIKLLAPHYKSYRGNMYKFLIKLLKADLSDSVRIIINNLKEKINNIDSYPDIRSLDYTLLMGAASFATVYDLQLIKILLESKFLDADQINNAGLNAFMIAITGVVENGAGVPNGRKYEFEIIKILSKYTKDLNVKDSERNANLNLLYSYIRDHLQVMKEDEKNGVIITKVEERLNKRNGDIIRCLLDTDRVDPTIKNVEGDSFIDLINRDNNKEMLSLVDKYYYRKKELTDSLFEAIDKEDIKSLRKMVTNFTIAVNDNNGDTALQKAVKIGNLDIIKLLLNAMPQLINRCNNKTQDNVLHTAIHNKHEDFISLIFKAAPYLAQWPNKDNKTPIDISVSYPLFCFKIFFEEDTPKPPTISSSSTSSSLLLKKSEDGVKNTDIISMLLKANEALSHSENGQITGENEEEASNSDGENLLKKLKRRRVEKR